MNRYADLKNAYGNNLREYYIHYIYSGKKEGRNARAVGSLTVYNGVDYSSVYQYTYYINNGKKEGRSGKGTSEIIDATTNYGGIDYSIVYDYKYYVDHNPDIK